jgi:hypothetical protein
MTIDELEALTRDARHAFLESIYSDDRHCWRAVIHGGVRVLVWCAFAYGFARGRGISVVEQARCCELANRGAAGKN